MARGNTEVKDMGWDLIVTELEKAHKMVVKVGFPDAADIGTATVEGSGKEAASSMSEVAQIAAYNEFGTDRIPARPFFRTAMDTGKEKIKELSEKTYSAVLEGKMGTEQALGLIGELGTSLVKASITTGNWEKNTDLTIARKGSSKPLIDTGQMRNSVTYVVTGKSERVKGSMTL